MPSKSKTYSKLKALNNIRSNSIKIREMTF
jgi:hypothetical protein